MVDDKELDAFVEDDLQKDINQLDKIDPSVEQHLNEMGFLWDRVQQKMQEDNTCYSCKKQIKTSKEDTEHLSYILQASGTEKGVVAFVSICEDCNNKTEKTKE